MHGMHWLIPSLIKWIINAITPKLAGEKKPHAFANAPVNLYRREYCNTFVVMYKISTLECNTHFGNLICDPT